MARVLLYAHPEALIMRLNVLLGVASVASALAVVGARDASACGGCFHPPNDNPSAITDHRMILSVSPQQTTLYDQIHYAGNPASFAWVLPISGTVTVGLSADALFTALDNGSATSVIAPQPQCPGPPPGCATPVFSGTAADSGAVMDSGVTVTHHEVVGPYETVQLHSTDPTALNAWLTTNNFAVPADVQPIIAAYVNEHFDFLALKLVPGAGVQAMQPVRVTTQGASAVLPLRMVAAGTGATVGITLWVVAEGRYEPQNFPWFRIEDSELSWDWTANQSNYRALRASKTAAMGGAGWELESSLGESQASLRSTVQFGSRIYNYNGDAGSEYAAIPPTDAGPGETSDQVMQDDLNALFAGMPGDAVRVTRWRADLSRSALANDLVLQASGDQTQATNLRHPALTTGAPQCPVFNCDPGGGGGVAVNPNNPPGASGGRESFSCTTSTESTLADPFTIAGIAGFLGLSFLHARRRRSQRSSR